MTKRKTIFIVLWIFIVIIAAASLVSLIVLPQWKGIFIAGTGGFLMLNLFLSMFFIRKNKKD